ncbi:hypothetical protein WJX72_004258 [[Myrmecia] bisecta]|uniref:Mechanosensitive ion channel protein n=1 Tax=[Myrmecia] bisecta TaxID=41462 RepID=A0AAW1QPZ9_9CHLO
MLHFDSVEQEKKNGHRVSPGRGRVQRGQVKVQSILVPDISPDPALGVAACEAMRTKGLAMPLWEVGARTVFELALAFSLVALLKMILKRIADYFEARMEDKCEAGTLTSEKHIVQTLVESGVSALQQPAGFLLPTVALVHSLRVATLALQIFLERVYTPGELGYQFASGVMHGLERMDVLCRDVSTVGIIAFTCWYLLSWKDTLVDLVQKLEDNLQAQDNDTAQLNRIVLPFSSLFGWAIVLIGALTSLHVFGVNIQPMLAVGGVGGLALGFGAQAISANAISGVNLFLSRPFVVGDRVELKTTSGGSVLLGYVERIDPMRTVFRTDKNVPVAIPNRAITDMIISNESRLGSSTVVTNFKDPRQYSTTVGLRYEDIKKVPAIIADLKAWLADNPGVNKKLGYGAALSSLGDYAVNIGISAHCYPSAFGNFNQQVLNKVIELVEKHGADFAYPTTTMHIPQLANNPAAAS